MSEFECPVVRVQIEPHPNADAIEIARVGGYQCIVRKGQLSDGDLAVYIPEQSVVPEWLLRQMEMWDGERNKGGLAGSLGNRVKAIKLRGVVSQGLILPGISGDDETGPIKAGEMRLVIGQDGSNDIFEEGENAADFLGITKYVQALPSHLSGRAIGVDFHATHNYDFENIKKHPSLFEEGEQVVITEKIHGSLLMIGVVPEKDANEKYYRGRVIISSKGLGGRGIVLDHNDETVAYAQVAKKFGLMEKAFEMLNGISDDLGKTAFIFGEVYGKTQSGKDLQTGFAYNSDSLEFRAFDICVGNRGSEEFLAWPVFAGLCDVYSIPHVPELFIGAYSPAMLADHTDGLTTLGGKHIREGVVMKSLNEDRHPHYGRKIAKSISEAYLFRKGETTEFN